MLRSIPTYKLCSMFRRVFAILPEMMAQYNLHQLKVKTSSNKQCTGHKYKQQQL